LQAGASGHKFLEVIVRVIIVGSGIAGLSAAIGLRKVGIDVTVYERAPELREVGAGISLWGNALRALDYLGAGQAIRSRSLSMVRSEIRAHEGRKGLVSFSAEQLEKQIGVVPVVAMIHRADLVGALSECLPEGIARYGFECVSVEQTENRVSVRFANGQTDEADAVVGADGINSAVRTALIGSEKPRYSGYTCCRGIGPRPASISAGYMGEWWGRGKRFGIATLPHDRAYWFGVYNAPADQHSLRNRSSLTAMFQGWADPVTEIITNASPESLIYGDIIDRPPTNTWSKGRIGLIGDAVHPTTPNLGQGGCMAIEDSVALARAMAINGDPAAAFAAFRAERYTRTSTITNESWRLGKVAQWEGQWSCWLRDAMLGLLLPMMGSRGVSKNASFDIGPLPAK
jgi:FAD-dependent urate hydroxylase